jgi:N-hydroxyarylamine O-acetyltransferase
MSFALDAYLARIGHSGARAPTAETLHAVHAAHALAIPFENLDILLGRGVSLDPARLAAKLVDARRGGYCFEHNSLLAAALRALGFSVELLGARVRMGPPRPNLPPRTHCLLRVTIDGAPWLADVGFGGDGLIDPLPWREDEELVTPSGRYRLAREGGDTVLHASHFGAEPLALYMIRADDPLLPIDLEMGNWFTSTHPSSPFTQRPIAQKIERARRLRLVGGELTIRHADGSIDARAVGEPDLLDVLEKEFGLDFPAGTRFSAAAASG